jgi:hypothetical protein
VKGAKHPPLVEVVWKDAVTYAEAMPIKSVLEKAPLATRTTSGYLIAAGTEDGRTIIAHTSDATANPEDSEVADITVIPTGWVQSIRYHRGKPRTKKEK